MTIQSIGGTSVALYITPADLKEHGLTPAGLTLERALALTQEAFGREGITLEGSIEIEAYPDACGVLVFAHIRPAQRIWYSFDGLEPLLEAARSLQNPPEEAALYWWEGRYWLSLPAAAERAANHCCEFGRVERDQPHLEARLAEYGVTILPGGALSVLVRHFFG